MNYKIFSKKAILNHRKVKSIESFDLVKDQSYTIILNKRRRKIHNAFFIQQINEDSFLFRFYDEKFENVERIVSVKRNNIIK